MTHVYEGQPDARQSEERIETSRFRPRYRALSEEEKALRTSVEVSRAATDDPSLVTRRLPSNSLSLLGLFIGLSGAFAGNYPVQRSPGSFPSATHWSSGSIFGAAAGRDPGSMRTMMRVGLACAANRTTSADTPLFGSWGAGALAS